MNSESERALFPRMFTHTRNLSWWKKLPVQKDRKCRYTNYY